MTKDAVDDQAEEDQRRQIFEGQFWCRCYCYEPTEQPSGEGSDDSDVLLGDYLLCCQSFRFRTIELALIVAVTINDVDKAKEVDLDTVVPKDEKIGGNEQYYYYSCCFQVPSTVLALNKGEGGRADDCNRQLLVVVHARAPTPVPMVNVDRVVGLPRRYLTEPHTGNNDSDIVVMDVADMDVDAAQDNDNADLVADNNAVVVAVVVR